MTSEDPGMGVAIGFIGTSVLGWVSKTTPIWGTMGPIGWIIGGGMAI